MAKKLEDTSADITVDNLVIADPQVARPTELPLIVKPPEGQSWKNPQQEAYAKVLNAAAYSIPNWSVNQISHEGKVLPNSSIRDVELARLVEIGNNPDRYYTYTGEVRPSIDPNSPNPSFTVTPKNVLGS